MQHFTRSTKKYLFRIPPALSNFIDHFPYDCWTMKPGAIVTYSMGNFGGIVAGTQLRTMTHIIQLIAIPKGMNRNFINLNYRTVGPETDCGPKLFLHRTLANLATPKPLYWNLGLTIPNVQFQIEEDGSVVGERKESIEKNCDKMLEDLTFIGEALLNQKKIQK